MGKVLLLITFLPSAAFAFGDTGHRIVCELAFLELDPEARSEVNRLIGLDADYENFAESCNWADRLEKRPRDHYINISRNQGTITIDECPLADSCLFPAIKSDFDILSDKSNSDRERLDALKFLGHWVGDIHQPMHVSFQDDRGANEIKVKGTCCGSLHGVWDGCIIERQLGKDASATANRYFGTVSAVDRAAWHYDSPTEWANESFQLTLRSEMGYCRRQDGACWYSMDNMMLDDGEPRREITITRAYLSVHQKVIELRLKQAGVRLGAMLNKALQ